MRDSSETSGPLPRGGPDSRAGGDPPAADGPGVDALRRVSTRIAYETPWIRVREDEVLRTDGALGVYSVVERDDYALVLPRENGGFWLVEQFRYPVGRRAWEFPAGGWPHGSAGGDAEALARAELREETGLRAGTMTHLGRLSVAYGFVAQSVDVFLAEDLEHGEHEREDTEQDMRQQWFPDAEIAAMIRSGAIVETAVVAALTLLRLHEDAAG